MRRVLFRLVINAVQVLLILIVSEQIQLHNDISMNRQEIDTMPRIFSQTAQIVHASTSEHSIAALECRLQLSANDANQILLICKMRD
jgi:hypothetical protein